MSTDERDTRITVHLTWDEAGFLWYDGMPVASVADCPGRFAFVDERGRHRCGADATVDHPVVRGGSVLRCGTHVQARLLARVLTAHGHLAHVLGDTEATQRPWVVLTSCALAAAPGGRREAIPLRAVS